VIAGPVLIRYLSEQEDRDLLRIVRGEGSQNSVRMRRAVMVRASADATSPEIARVLAADPDTVRDVIHAFNDDGFAALDPHWGPGRPRRITTDDEDYLTRVATTRPVTHDRDGDGACPAMNAKAPATRTAGAERADPTKLMLIIATSSAPPIRLSRSCPGRVSIAVGRSSRCQR
jgi:hypothetical protein